MIIFAACMINIMRKDWLAMSNNKKASPQFTDKYIIGCGAGEYIAKMSRGKGSGTILGVFHNGWYLEAGENIWSIYNKPHGEIPFGVEICTDLPYEKAWEGLPFTWHDGVLEIPCARLHICVPPFTTHEGTMLQKNARDNMKKAICVNKKGYLWQLASEATIEVDRDDPISHSFHIYYRKSKDKIHSFLRTLSNENWEDIEDSLRSMIGFGIGLTPSLDDWLLGFIYTLNVSGCSAIWIKKLCQIVNAIAADCTNNISAEYLKAAAKGSYYELLNNALCGTDERAAEQVISVGSSSGSDMLTGAIFAIDYLVAHGYII